MGPLAWLTAMLVGPFVLAQAGGWSGGRSFSAELGSALGVSAVAVLAIVLLLPTRLRAISGLGADAAVRLHRHLVPVLLALLAGHIVMAVVMQPSRYVLLRFIGQPWRAQAAVSSVACLAALIMLSVWRRPLHIPYTTWRALHGALATGCLVLAVAHTYGWNRYLVHGGGALALATLLLAPVGALARLRWRRRSTRATYILEEVVHEAGRSTSLFMVAEGPRAPRFAPGQFAWLRLADGATRFAEHPFSYSSSAADPLRIAFTIRAYDGFSARVARLPVGTRFEIDGPHGAFRLRRRSPGTVLLAYGIGITPSMSILRTAAERGDRRRYVLLYANRTLEEVTFGAELDALSRRIDLKIVYILSQPPERWYGERGRLTATILERHLPPDLAGWQFFLCGASAPVEAGVTALEAVGVPPERVHAERFVDV